uniref:Uncharacterized protein n=1 Tax=Opuntia streptacantha TaxID=393608 RepID=A0A7C9F9A9_OPUST
MPSRRSSDSNAATFSSSSSAHGAASKYSKQDNTPASNPIAAETFKMPRTLGTSSLINFLLKSLQYINLNVSIYTSTSSQSAISTAKGGEDPFLLFNFPAKNRLCPTRIWR